MVERHGPLARGEWIEDLDPAAGGKQLRGDVGAAWCNLRPPPERPADRKREVDEVRRREGGPWWEPVAKRDSEECERNAAQDQTECECCRSERRRTCVEDGDRDDAHDGDGGRCE